MSIQQEASKLLDIMSSVTPTVDALNTAIGSGIVFGIVTSIDPLTVFVDNRKTVPASLIILSPFCIRAEFDNFIPTEKRGGGTGEAAYEEHDHDFHVGLWRGLQIGDRLAMVMSSDKQQYYALHRIGMIFGDMGGST